MTEFYYFASDGQTGTKTTGSSATEANVALGVAGSWADSNCYASPETAYNWWRLNDGSEAYLVANDGTVTATSGANRFNLNGITTADLHIISRSGATLLTTTVEDVALIPNSPGVASSGNIFGEAGYGFTLGMQTGGDANAEQIEISSTNAGVMKWIEVTVDSHTTTAAQDVTNGRIIEYDGSVGLELEDCVFTSNDITNTNSAGLISTDKGTAVFDNLTWQGNITDNTLSGAAHIYLGGTAALTWNGGDVSTNQVINSGNAARHGIVRVNTSGAVVINDVDCHDNTAVGNNAAGSNLEGLFCGVNATAGSVTLNRCTYRSNSFSLYDNQRGGLLSRIGGGRAAHNDCRVYGNAGPWGIAGYAGGGGGLDIARLIAYDNSTVTPVDINPETTGVVYFGGGDEDCSLKAALIRDTTGTSNGIALYIHNSDTPTVPGPRTVVIEHLTTVGNGTGRPIIINGLNQALTVNFINCAFGESDPIEVGGTAAQVTLNFTNCATSHATIAAAITGSGFTLNEAGTVSTPGGGVNADGTPTAVLLGAGSSSATATLDVIGDTYDVSAPTIGAYQKLSGAPFYIAITRRTFR